MRANLLEEVRKLSTGVLDTDEASGHIYLAFGGYEALVGEEQYQLARLHKSGLLIDPVTLACEVSKRMHSDPIVKLIGPALLPAIKRAATARKSTSLRESYIKELVGMLKEEIVIVTEGRQYRGILRTMTIQKYWQSRHVILRIEGVHREWEIEFDDSDLSDASVEFRRAADCPCTTDTWDL
jgi:hypothetical protein